MSIQKVSDPLQPIASGERIPSLDILRGFALFGVLLAYTVWNLGSPPEETYSQVDRILNQTLAFLVDTKFYTLFATLFGIGFSMQLNRASTRGVSVVPTYCRRLLALLLIGLVHALFLRNGDILVPYAVMGFILLLFRNASNTVLAVAAVIAIIYPYLARAAWGLTEIPFPQRPEAAGQSYLAENLAWIRYWYSTAITFWPGFLPLFLFGLYLGRIRLVETISQRKGLWIWLIAGLLVGVCAYWCLQLLNTVWTTFPRPLVQQILTGVLWSVHAWGLAVFYALSLLLLLQKPHWQRWLAPLGAVGRTALTNYILQAVIIVPVCMIFNLFDKVNPVMGVFLALGVWVLQVLASMWWLKRFEFGPVEWVWRSLTYGRPQRMRIVTKQDSALNIG